MNFDINNMRSAVRHGRLEWQRHSLERMAQRGLRRDDALDVLLHGD